MRPRVKLLCPPVVIIAAGSGAYYGDGALYLSTQSRGEYIIARRFEAAVTFSSRSALVQQQ